MKSINSRASKVWADENIIEDEDKIALVTQPTPSPTSVSGMLSNSCEGIPYIPLLCDVHMMLKDLSSHSSTEQLAFLPLFRKLFLRQPRVGAEVDCGRS